MDLGHVREVIYDYVTGEPVWIGAGHLLRTLLLPASSLSPEGDHLRTTYASHEIEDEPLAHFGEGFDDISEERHLYGHFGLPLQRERELRVLRQEDDLPGLERVSSIED
jgi:hypothetical protein